MMSCSLSQLWVRLQLLMFLLGASCTAFSPRGDPSTLAPDINSIGTSAFVPDQAAASRRPTAVWSTELDSDPLADVRTSYIETSRQYRRTRFAHDDWLKHRSPDRFFKNLGTILFSGIYRGIAKEVLTVTGIATFIWAWNLFLGEGYVGLDGVHQDPIAELPLLRLPLTPFTLASPSLGLLLVFRTNASYSRWDEARKAWGLIINHSRNIARMGTAWSSKSIEPSDDIRREKLQHLAKCIWAFPRSLARHMESPFISEADYVADLLEKLDPDQAEGLIASAHRPNRALFDLSNAVNDLPMHALRRNEIDKSIVVLGDQLGGSERLFSSPVPLFYTKHTARYLTAWLVFLPFALYEPFGSTYNHFGMIPCAAVLSIFLFGIEELAIQLEEPFSILPLLLYTNTIGNNAVEIISWHFIEEDTSGTHR
mmetsp:Transcript_23414/g.50788  ORF Transcript_23414/g.50788 Transcript_23414/m.50788 type:complete len:425 (-) Transcript_23414:142-1416(-)